MAALIMPFCAAEREWRRNPDNNPEYVGAGTSMATNEDDVRRIFAATLKLPPNAVPLDASPDTIAAWDSMGHMRLVTAVETELAVKLTMEQVLAIDSFAALCRIVAAARNGG
jgi:acyl carrier protein